jgi:uncharacterized membrane protein
MASRGKAAAAARKTRPSRWATFATHSQAQIRFLIAFAVGLTVFLLAPIADWVTRALAGWNAGGWLYFALVVIKMWRAEIEGIKREADIERESRIAVLIIVILGAFFAMLALLTQLSVMKTEHGAGRSLSIVLSMSTIFLSWLLIHLVFAVFYAHEFHSERSGKTNASGGGGLKFPGEKSPDYLDFIYFSFVVGMTAQTSDVCVTSRAMRRVVVVHGVLSFFFNTAVIALAVNIASQLVQG